MPTLQMDSSGNLLKKSDGSLMGECCCGTCPDCETECDASYVGDSPGIPAAYYDSATVVRDSGCTYTVVIDLPSGAQDRWTLSCTDGTWTLLIEGNNGPGTPWGEIGTGSVYAPGECPDTITIPFVGDDGTYSYDGDYTFS